MDKTGYKEKKGLTSSALQAGVKEGYCTEKNYLAIELVI